MDYQQLFELSIIHDYYRSKICPDLSIEPTPECNQFLANHRLMVKRKVNGISIIVPVVEGNKPLLGLAENATLTFFLKTNNSHFFNFTNIDPKFIRTPIGCYIYSFSNEKKTEIGVSSLDSTLIAWDDLKLLQRQNIFGIVKIYNNLSFPKISTQASDYNIHFQSKKHYWYYYLIADNKNNDDVFFVEDREDAREPKIKFTKTDLTQLNESSVQAFFGSKFSGKRLYLFKSDTEITCQEEGRKNIQLLKQSGKNSKTVWIDHLPNPPNHTGIKVINALKSV